MSVESGVRDTNHIADLAQLRIVSFVALVDVACTVIEQVRADVDQLVHAHGGERPDGEVAKTSAGSMRRYLVSKVFQDRIRDGFQPSRNVRVSTVQTSINGYLPAALLQRGFHLCKPIVKRAPHDRSCMPCLGAWRNAGVVLNPATMIRGLQNVFP